MTHGETRENAHAGTARRGGLRVLVFAAMGLSEQRYIEVHQRFLEARRCENALWSETLDYRAYNDPGNDPYPGFRMRMVEESKSGVRELLNWINHFGRVIEDYSAWSEVLAPIENEQERLSILFEIVSPVSFLALSFPAAIRGKFVFVCGRMIRDTFRIKGKNGKSIEDHHLNENVLSTLVARIPDPTIRSTVDSFTATLTEIDGKAFRETTNNYRNRANHGITPNIEIGQMMAFGSMSGEGFEGFTFGVERAIKIDTLIQPLVEQHRNCMIASEAFIPVIAKFRENWRASPA